MKAHALFLLTCFAFILLNVETATAQDCEYWSEPAPLSDSLTDNHNPTLVAIPQWGSNYYVFWERSFEDAWSEIVYADYYSLGEPQVLFHADGFDVSNVQVIPAWGTYPDTDTLAFVFYVYNSAGYQDIYYQVMTDTGFTGSTRFTNTTLNESHLRVSSGGGMVWQEGDKIKFSRLYNDNSGFHFEPVVTVDEGDCRNPDIQNATGYWLEEFLAWEKGSNEEPEIWYSQWGWDSGQWSLPIQLFNAGERSGIRFSKVMADFPTFPVLLSDVVDESEQYSISGYDFYSQDEFISDFSQSGSFQADYFTINIITDNYWELGYLAFSKDEGNGNQDIYSSDEGYLVPELNGYCRIDSTARPDRKPQLFDGAWHFSYFDLVCIWESWVNGHWQLFSATTPVVIGNVPETGTHNELIAKAFPNPFSEYIRIESQTVGESPVILTIFNALGQIVMRMEANNAGGDKFHKEIETAGFPPGIYLLRMEAGKRTNTMRLIKR
jgi:hypothetical protein